MACSGMYRRFIMLKLYSKIFSIPKTVIVSDEFFCENIEIIGKRLDEKIKKIFKRSLSIREVDAGSDNSCEQELTALSNSYYDIERFGIRFVASPRHADALIVTGPVSRNMADALKKTYEATPDPKLVIAVGDGAINGGVFRGSYAIYDSVKDIVPVDFQIPGDPPSPKTILCSLLLMLEQLEKKQSNQL